VSESSGTQTFFDVNKLWHREQFLVEARSTKIAAVKGGEKKYKKAVREYQNPNFYSTA